MLCLHNTWGNCRKFSKNCKEVKDIMIMIIDIFLCYVIFDWQLKIICRKSSATPEQIHSPLFTHSSPKNSDSCLFANCRKGGKGRTLRVCYLKYPWKQCNSLLNISSINLETCEIFLKFNINISNPVIFLLIFKYILITCSNIMTCNLQLRVISNRHCFGIQQPHVQCFL